MNPQQINPFTIAAAALSYFPLSGLWYSPNLFGRVWMQEHGFTETLVQGFSNARPLGSSAVLALVMATNLAFFIADEKTTFT